MIEIIFILYGLSEPEETTMNQRAIVEKTKTFPIYKVFETLKKKKYIKKFKVGANKKGNPTMVIKLKNGRYFDKTIFPNDPTDPGPLQDALLNLYFATLMDLVLRNEKLAKFVCNECGDISIPGGQMTIRL